MDAVSERYPGGGQDGVSERWGRGRGRGHLRLFDVPHQLVKIFCETYGSEPIGTHVSQIQHLSVPLQLHGSSSSGARRSTESKKTSAPSM